MRLSDYQASARRTDQFPTRSRTDDQHPDKAELVPLLGLVGEVGTLLAEYKKLLRDGPVHLRFRERVAEELGDTLWYVATVATKFGLDLDAVAAANLEKNTARWIARRRARSFDSGLTRGERLPRSFTYSFFYGKRKDGSPGVGLLDENGRQIGALLTDNAHREDGYRFHDVMHFAFVAALGWSPVARSLLGRKRKSKPKLDEIEDGGRAVVIDEAVVAMVFTYIGGDLGSTTGMRRIDTEALRGIRAMTRGYEVHSRTEAEWERAILQGLHVWRQVEEHDGGTVVGDFASRTFAFRPPRRNGRRSAKAG